MFGFPPSRSYGGGFPSYGGGYPSFNQSSQRSSLGDLQGIASLFNMFAQMSPEQFDTGIARLNQFQSMYGRGGFGGQFSGGMMRPSPARFSSNSLGMPFGNSIRQGSVNTPSFSSSSPNALFSNASLIGQDVTRTLTGPGGQSMQVLANDPRFSGKTESEIQQMVFGPQRNVPIMPQGLSSLQEQQRQLTGGVATGGQGQFSQISPDVLQKSLEREQRIANAVPAGFVANSVLNPEAPIGQVYGAPTGYTNPQTGEKIFISTRGDNVGEITRRIAAPEGYQPREVPSPFQGLRVKGMSPENARFKGLGMTTNFDLPQNQSLNQSFVGMF